MRKQRHFLKMVAGKYCFYARQKQVMTLDLTNCPRNIWSFLARRIMPQVIEIQTKPFFFILQ